MSVQNQINRIGGNITNALSAVAEKGVTVPEGSNSDNLADLIAEIQTSGEGGTGGSDISLGLTGATAGQIAKIIAVDDTGKPTAWEAADMPSGGGVQSDWNQNDSAAPDYVKNRPFWKEVVKKSLTEAMTGETTVTVTTVEENGSNFATGMVGYQLDTTNYVIFDGVEYECSPHYDSNIGAGIGSPDFSEYPFFIGPGIIFTQTAGEHTIEQYFDETVIRANYAPYLEIRTERTEDGTPYLTMEDVEKIKTAFTNGVPVRLDSNYGKLALTMNVLEVTESFISAFSIVEGNSGCTKQTTYKFSVRDGSLRYSGVSTLGQVDENGNEFPVMRINNMYYKITVDDNGKLTATEIT